MQYTFDDYPPFVSFEELTRWPVQWSREQNAVIWRNQRGIQVGILGRNYCPPPQKQPVS